MQHVNAAYIKLKQYSSRRIFPCVQLARCSLGVQISTCVHFSSNVDFYCIHKFYQATQDIYCGKNFGLLYIKFFLAH